MTLPSSLLLFSLRLMDASAPPITVLHSCSASVSKLHVAMQMYYLNPVSWTLYGLVASNVGDLDNASINLNGGVGPDDIVTVPQFLRQQFDYRHVSESSTPARGKLPVLSVKRHSPVNNCCQECMQIQYALALVLQPTLSHEHGTTNRTSTLST